MTYTLLTGCTGLVGHYLLRDLQLAGRKLAVLVRKTDRASAEERVQRVLQIWEQQGVSIPEPVVLEGDITEPNCGLSDEEVKWLKTHCDSVVHSAASVSFNQTADGEPWRTNVEGTQSLLELCERNAIHQFHYVSTAYVSGMKTGPVLEDDNSPPTAFRNKYEQSKLVAENLIRDANFLNSVTIYRPPFIAGDSETGFTTSYHGLFHHLRLISLIVKQQPMDENGIRRVDFRLPCSGKEQRNCVPIDWVSAVMARLIGKRK